MAKIDLTTSKAGHLILELINNKLKLERGFRADTKRSQDMEMRIKEHGAETVMAVVDFMYDKWRGWAQRDQYFNPTTLFRKSNFERYLEDYTVGTEQTQKAFKPIQNERKQESGTLGPEEYKNHVLGHSDYVNARFQRLSEQGKMKFDQFLNKLRTDGVPARQVNLVNFLQEVK